MNKTIHLVQLETEQLEQIISQAVSKGIKEANVINEPQPEKAEANLTRKEVAKALKISLSTVDNYRKAGILKSYKIGSRVLFSENEIINSKIGKLCM